MSIQTAQPGCRIVRAACSHDCPDACALLVTVRDGRAVAVGPNPDHPITGHNLCPKVDRYLDRVYSPDRLLTPLRRAGPKGLGRFEPATWDEALNTIAGRWREIVAADGAAAILPYSYLGSLGVLTGFSTMHALFHRLGASRLERTICGGQNAGLRELVGTAWADPEDLVEARLIVAWGFDPISTSIHTWNLIREARRRGARLIAIDPYRSRTAAQADLHLPILPGTDAALALGVLRVIFEEGLENAEYLERATTGVEALREHVASWTPDRTAKETGLTPDLIVAFAREYAAARPAAIRHGIGLQRAAGAGMAIRAIQCLPAVAGHWRHVGGGIADARAAGAFNLIDLIRPDLGPSPRTLNMIQIGRHLTDPNLDPPIKSLYVWNANPAVVAPDQGRVIAGLSREDLFTVVHDQFLTDTARYADVVLPATTMLEHDDVIGSWGFNYLALSRRAIDPVGEAKSNTEVARLLAARLGFEDDIFRLSDADLIELALAGAGGDRAEAVRQDLADRGFARVGPPRGQAPFAEGGFPTPSGKFEFESEALGRAGLGPLPAYVPPAESPATRPDLAARYPLRLLTLKRHHSINSSYGALPVLRRAEPDPAIEIHPDDAAPRGLHDGAPARVWNDRGSVRYRVRVSDRVRSGTVVVPFGHWNEGGSGANALTSDRLGDIGHGPTFCDALVEVATLDE